MEIVHEVLIGLQRDTFLNNATPPSRPHLSSAFHSHRYWYSAIFNKDDFLALYIAVSPIVENGNSPQKLGLSINELNDNRGLLTSPINKPTEGVDTKRVDHYLTNLKTGQLGVPLQTIFIIPKDFGIGNVWYVIDGMHRLLAYGLYLIDTNFEYRDITCFVGSNEELT